MIITAIDVTASAGVSRLAAISPAHKHLWPTATKSAFYANFYPADEALEAAIG